MKINWGTGIVLALVGFISFILYFVVRMGLDDRANHDLVTEEYYKAELGYQKEIDAEKNANKNARITMDRTPDGLVLNFPEKLDPKKIKGTVSLYRPSNKHLDFDLPVSLSNTHLLIPDKRLLDGRWDIKVSWQYGDELYMHKESLTY
ncbi:FixH family protein [Kriegella aquimaris]|uniref:Nitrogen fixation protein FixH n=1 Tax=Kriegella aquimaris TaxID=192904 RepID=A0A1G9KFA5_9FLAO|nr:FixH family protein [Kriegella aquimaris]SDL48570.1 Nitrogen fixation protein FixH [Kriegella aquimaris]